MLSDGRRQFVGDFLRLRFHYCKGGGRDGLQAVAILPEVILGLGGLVSRPKARCRRMSVSALRMDSWNSSRAAFSIQE